MSEAGLQRSENSSLATSRPPGGRPTRVRYQVLAAGCSLAVLTYILRVGFATISGELNRTLGLNDRQVGALMAAFMIGYGLFEIPWGRLGDRVGVRNVLATIVLAASALTATLGLVVLFPAEGMLAFAFLLVLRFLFGGFQAATFPSISRMMADWMPSAERGSAQGAIWMCSRVGGALAPVLLTTMIATMGDWKLPLALVSSLGLLWCLFFWPWFRNHPEQMRQVNAEELARIQSGRVRAGSWAHTHAAIPWRAILTSRSAWCLCLMYGFLGFSGNFYLTMLPTYLRNHRNLDLGTAGLLAALPFACGAAACLVGGSLSDILIRKWSKAWGRRLVGLTGMTLAAFSIIIVPWVDSTFALATLLILTFIGNDLAIAPAWASAADIGHQHTGVLSGTMNMTASFMAALESVLMGGLFEQHQLVLPFMVLAGSYVLGAVCWTGVDGRKSVAGD